MYGSFHSVPFLFAGRSYASQCVDEVMKKSLFPTPPTTLVNIDGDACTHVNRTHPDAGLVSLF
jgi:hypothetical protein